MRKYTVKETARGWVACDVRGNEVIPPQREECYAHLYGSHWANRPSLQKRLKLKKRDGVLTGRPFAGVEVKACFKQASGEWRAVVAVDGNIVIYIGRTMREVLQLIDKHGDDPKTTRNILNRDSGDIAIARRSWGGCTDPGTELYHCM